MTDTEDLRPLRLTDRKRKILITIAQSPRKAKYFTHGDLLQVSSPHSINIWLKDLCDHGLIVEEKEVFHITIKGRQRLDQADAATAGVRSVMHKGTYTGEPYQYFRPGSDHSHIRSKGFSC